MHVHHHDVGEIVLSQEAKRIVAAVGLGNFTPGHRKHQLEEEANVGGVVDDDRPGAGHQLRSAFDGPGSFGSGSGDGERRRRRSTNRQP